MEYGLEGVWFRRKYGLDGVWLKWSMV